MRIMAAVVLFLLSLILFGEATVETPIRVLLSAVLMGACLLVACGEKRKPLALFLWALVLPIHATRVPWLVIAALAAASAAFVMYMVRRDRASRSGFQPVGEGAPFVDVEPKTYRHRPAHGAAIVMLALPAIVTLTALIMQEFVVAIVSALVLMMFGLIWLLAWRPRYRVDAEGIHGRMFFGEVTVRWPDVAVLETASTRMGAYQPRDLKICCVHSATASVRFYNSIVGADELQQTIADATGLGWP